MIDLVLNLGLLFEQFLHLFRFQGLAQPGIDLVVAVKNRL